MTSESPAVEMRIIRRNRDERVLCDTCGMLEGSCHCGAVTWVIDGKPESATACHCTVCRRYAALWASGYEGERITVSAATSRYAPGEETLGFHFSVTADARRTGGRSRRTRTVGAESPSICGWRSRRSWSESRSIGWIGSMSPEACRWMVGGWRTTGFESTRRRLASASKPLGLILAWLWRWIEFLRCNGLARQKGVRR